MTAFRSGREAKEFLISKIVAEAESEKIPLSEVERKMLYFTESGWTLPDIMKVNEQFDLEYDQDDYEEKVSKLVNKAYRRICNGSRDEYDRWWASIHFLQREDHYVLVMMEVDVKTDNDAVQVSAPKTLFLTSVMSSQNGAGYDVTREGNRFLLLNWIFDTPAPLTLVMNWEVELKK